MQCIIPSCVVDHVLFDQCKLVYDVSPFSSCLYTCKHRQTNADTTASTTLKFTLWCHLKAVTCKTQTIWWFQEAAFVFQEKWRVSCPLTFSQFSGRLLLLQIGCVIKAQCLQSPVKPSHSPRWSLSGPGEHRGHSKQCFRSLHQLSLHTYDWKIERARG